MPTLQQSIRLYNGMSGPLKNITKAMNIVIADFQHMQKIAKNPIYTENLNVARQELAQASVKIGQMESFIQRSEKAQQGFNRSLQSGASAAMYQLNQAMASGRLQGDEYRSIIENAPLLAQSIENYMRTVVKVEGSMKDWSSAGMLTADVIKNAMFASADQVEQRFAQMPMTAAQIWTQFKNSAVESFQPVSEKWNNLLNSRSFQLDVNGAIADISNLSSGAITLFEQVVNAVRNIGQAIKGPLSAASGVLGNIIKNWRIILPIVVSAVAALLMRNATSDVKNWGKSMAEETARANEQIEENANQEMAAAESAKVLYERFETLYGKTNRAAKDIDEMRGITSQLNSIIPNLNAGFSNEASALENLKNKLKDATKAFYDFTYAQAMSKAYQSKIYTVAQNILQAEDTQDGYKDQRDKVTKDWYDYSQDHKLEKEMGSGVYAYEMAMAGEKRISLTKNISDTQDIIDQNKATMAGYASKMQEQQKALSDLGNRFEDKDAGGGKSLGNIDQNTKRTADALDIAEEDLKYMRDLAERDTINRFTTAEIKVDMGGVVNQVSANTDLDGVVAYLTDSVQESMKVAAEGVYS